MTYYQLCLEKYTNVTVKRTVGPRPQRRQRRCHSVPYWKIKSYEDEEMTMKFGHYSHRSITLHHDRFTARYDPSFLGLHTAITDRPLEYEELFQVVVGRVNNGYRNGPIFQFGLTWAKSVLSGLANREKRFRLCVYPNKYLICSGEDPPLRVVHVNCIQHKKGSVYSVERSESGEVRFRINGVEAATIESNDLEELYGFCSLSELTREVSIIDEIW